MTTQDAEYQAMTDGQLLDRFVARHDDGAFHHLVARHSPKVVHRCRQVLRDGHDAEDALQATFLVLLRKAASIQKPELLGHWLCGVAYRIAVRLRNRSARRRQREEPLVAMLVVPHSPGGTGHELRLAIDEELSRLPEKYRLPIVLCYWKGHTHEETADRLGWPVGTVKTRLVRAREILRRRLYRRGLSLI